MTEEGKKIHAFWYCLVALNVCLNKMTQSKAEKDAYKMIVEKYGEEKLRKELEI